MATLTSNVAVNTRIVGFNIVADAGVPFTVPDDLVDEVITAIRTDAGVTVTVGPLDRFGK